MTRELLFGKKDQRTTLGTKEGGLGFGARDKFTQNNNSTQRKLPNQLPEISLNPKRFLWNDDIPYGLLYADRSDRNKIWEILLYIAGFVEVWLSESALYHFGGDCTELNYKDARRKGDKVFEIFEAWSLPRTKEVIQLMGRYEAWGMSTAETVALAILEGMIIVTRYPENFEGIEKIEVWSLDEFYAYCIDSLREHLKRCYQNSADLRLLPPNNEPPNNEPPNDEPPSGPGGSPHVPGSLGGGGSLPPFPSSGPSSPPLTPGPNDNPGGSGSSNRSGMSNSVMAEFEALWSTVEAGETETSPAEDSSRKAAVLQHLKKSLAASLPEASDPVTPPSVTEPPVTTPKATVDPGLIANHPAENPLGSNNHDSQSNQDRGLVETQTSSYQASIDASSNPRTEAGNDSSITPIPASLTPGITLTEASSSASETNLDSPTNGTNGEVDVNPPQPIPVKQVSGANGNQIIPIQVGDGITIVDFFGGVGRGINPTPEIISAVDTLQFKGARFKAENMILTQRGNDLIITFEGDLVDQVVVRNFSLENLDNISQENGASITLVNILFDGDTSPQDSYDVVDANWVGNRVLKPNSVTFLNDQDNYVEGFDNANNVINGQGGNDILITFSGNDILRGGAGNDTLDGGAGINQLWGGSGNDTFVLHPYGLDYINDFTIGGDRIGLANGLSVNQLKIEQGTGVNSGSTLIKLTSTDTILAVLTGVQANSLTTDIFLPGFSDGFPPRTA